MQNKDALLMRLIAVLRLVIGIPLPELQLLHLVPQHILICILFFFVSYSLRPNKNATMGVLPIKLV